MVLHSLHRSAQPSVQQLLSAQRQSGHLCDVLLQLPAPPNQQQQLRCPPVAGNFCILAAHSTFIGDRCFRDGSIQFSVHKPLTIELAVDHQCAACLQATVGFLYDEPVAVEVGSEHVEHLRDLAMMLGLAELGRRLEAIDRQPELEEEEERLALGEETKVTDAGEVTQLPVEEIVLHFAKQPDRLQSRAGAFQYKAQRLSPTPAAIKKHTCPGCPFQCYRPADMLAHLHSCPSPNSLCILCDQLFPCVATFRAHLAHHSRPTLPIFFCATCDQRFATRTALSLHTPKHSPEAAHQCDACGKRFKWLHALRSHQQQRHAPRAQLLCDECGFGTGSLKTLRAHQMAHSGAAYRCSAPHCAYQSRRKENLRVHLLTHRGETPFVCEVCGHRFSQAKNLKRHALLHVARDALRCPHCEFGSSRTDKLKEHIGRQHAERPARMELQLGEEEEVASGMVKDGSERLAEATRRRERRKAQADAVAEEERRRVAADVGASRRIVSYVPIAPKPASGGNVT